MSARTDAIVEWLREQLSQSGANGFVVGLSGGIDSAVVARLCQEAAPAHVVGVIMPCHGDPQDEADARLVADHFGLPTARVDLAPVHDVLIEDLRYLADHLPQDQGAPSHHLAAPMANVKPRLRMTTLYFLANTLNYLVAGTGNRSEMAIGYVTKYGDGGADVLPIGHLLKSEVAAVAREIGVPDAILEEAPGAGLRPGRTDEEEEMGFSYAQLEAYLTKGPQRVAPALVMRIERLIRRSEHKRAVAPVPEPS
jgi:NAD+ synthase